MKIVLIFPNYTCMDELSEWWYPPKSKQRGDPTLPPLGLLYLHAVLSQWHNVVLIDNMVEKRDDHTLVDMILSHKPQVVGFGGTMLQWPQANRVASLLKNKGSGIVTVYGGPNATARPEKHTLFFDFVLRGMAEETFPQFLKVIESGQGLYEIEGLCWGSSFKGPCLKLPSQKSIWPSRKVLDWRKYRRTCKGLPFPTDSVLSSRGCPYACRFCSSKDIWNRKWFARDVQDVIKEIQWMRSEMGTKSLHFREDNFTVDKERLRAFCRELSLLGIPWICQSRVNAIDVPTVRMMKDAGCRMVSCGFESINDSTLIYIRKGQTADQVRNAIDVFESVGMHYTGAFIVATPNENAEEIQTTIRFAQESSRYPYSRLPSHACRFVGIPVSELYWEIQKDGLVEYDWMEGEMLFPRTRHLSSKDVDKVIEDCGSPSRP